MASRVNVKFVVILAAALTVVFGVVAALAYQAVRTSPDEHIERGDRLLAEGEYQKAADSYAKAVNKERTRIDYLDKWQTALLQTTPDTEIEYQRAYGMNFEILRTKAALLDTDAAAQQEYLEARMRQYKLVRPTPESWQTMAQEVEERIARLEPGAPETEALRRYRGLANNRLMQLLPDRIEVRQQSLEDLEAAVKAARELGREDIESEVAIVWWHLLEWRRSLRERRPERAETNRLAIEEALDELRERYPDNAEVLVNDLLVRLDLVIATEATPAARRAAIDQRKGSEEAAIRAMLRDGAASPDYFTIERLDQALRVLQPETAAATMLEIVEALLKSNPDDVFLSRMRAGNLALLNRHEEAVAEYQRIIDMPDRPVSLEGLALKGLRLECLRQQAESWLSVRMSATDQKTRDDALAAAKARRNALGERVRSGASNALRMIDAKIALAEDKPHVAVSQLNELDVAMLDSDPAKIDALALLAEALMRMNQPGAARAQFERMVSLNPLHTPAILAAAAIDVQLGEPQRAERRLEGALREQPENEQFKWRLSALKAREDGSRLEDVTDPIVNALLRVDQFRNQPEPNYVAARKAIVDTMAEHAGDTRLHAALLQVEAEAGDVEAFERALTDALARFPENSTFLDYKRRLELLESSDRIETMVKFIDESDSPPAQREVRKHDVYRQAERMEDADRALAKAESLDPNDPLVLERLFIRALSAGDTAKATDIAGRAARLNADQADGLMYQARLELARSDARAAQATLERATEKLPYSVLAWRMLGQVHMMLGQVDRAVSALQKAYDFQPQDLQTSQVLIQALSTLQRNPEALAIARVTRERHPRNREVNELWLQLEELAGDQQVALLKRMEHFRDAPTEKENIIALGRLMIQQRKWAEARALFDAAQGYLREDLEFAMLEARWRALQSGRPGVGVEAGREHLREYIGSLPAEKLDERPYLALGMYLIEHGLVDQGLAAYEQATRHQSPETMLADRVRADYLFDVGRYEEAVEPYNKLIAAKIADDDGAFAMRLAESYIKLGRFDEAAKTLDDSEKLGERSVVSVMLRADIARGRNDNASARRLLNEAVEMAPADTRPFLKRAQHNFEDPTRFQEVLSDLERAVSLQPTMDTARRMRALLYARAGQTTPALAELRAGVEAVPGSDELRTMLIAQLVEMGRFDEAHTVVEQAVRDRPGNPEWQALAGDIYKSDDGRGIETAQARDARYQRATELYRLSFEADPSMRTGFRLAAALLDKNPPEPRESLKVLEALGAEVDTRSWMLVIKARATAAAGDTARGAELAAQALGIARDTPELFEWLKQVKRMFPEWRDQLDFMQRVKPSSAVEEMFAVQLIKMELPLSSEHARLETDLTKILGESEDRAVRLEANRLIGTLQYAQKRYDDAVKTFRAGLALEPADLEFNNNLAFTLAKHMGDVEGAVAPAEKAVELAPNNAIALDTLGWVYFRLDRLSQAQSMLQRADAAATGAHEAAPAKLHLAQVMHKQGRLSDARELAATVKRILEAQPGLAVEYEADLNALMEQLKQAE